MQETLWQQWEKNAVEKSQTDAIIHWIPGKEPFRWTFENLLKTAKLFSIYLKNAGIKKNDVCALIIRHNPYFYPLYMGVSAMGAIPAVLAYPNPRLHPDKFRQGIIGMSQRSGLNWILTEDELLPTLKPLLERTESTIKGIHLPLEKDLSEIDINDFTAPDNIKDTDPFLLQHSSGTTGLQKPVLISHRALLDHAVYYGEALKQTGSDKVVSWLPLYHDMGLVASFHLPLIWGIPSVQINPFDWILAPELLIEATSKEKASLVWLPNFAFHLMANKIHDDDIAGCSLESLRLVVNSSEPIRTESFVRFTEKFVKFGFNPSTYSTLYGMAETTMAVTQTIAGTKISEVKADRQELSLGRLKFANDDPNARVCISAGSLIEGCEVKIVDDDRRKLSSGMVGEIAIKSVSMFDGYRNYPEKTAEAMHDGWFMSGDIGFELKGDYYIIGRKKDTIISAGKNIYPEDIEDLISLVKEIIPGRVIAFGENAVDIGTDLISIVAETAVDNEQESKNLKMEILKTAMDIDVTITNVYLVPPRWLIKSSAGKPGRNANTERIMEVEEKGKWGV